MPKKDNVEIDINIQREVLTVPLPPKKPKTPQQIALEELQKKEDFERVYQEASEDAEMILEDLEKVSPLQDGHTRISEEELRKGLTGFYMRSIQEQREIEEKKQQDKDGLSK